MECYLYIIYSEKNDRYYIGISQNLEERLGRHNNGATKSTKSGRPWQLVLFEKYESRSAAMEREGEIKRKKSRKYIEYLIRRNGVG